MNKYPTPQELPSTMASVRRIGWPGKPYYVRIRASNSIIISVEAKDGYRGVSLGRNGFIATTESPRRLKRLTHRYLRIAWRLNHNPRYAKDTATMAAEAISSATEGGK